MHSVISVDHAWKRYGFPMPEWWYRMGRKGDGPWALRDVSFSVERGETLGVIGRNGAGKSTLLKVLAGVTPPTRGNCKVVGRVFPMIELNAGLHGELTGRENVYLLGAVMGLLRHEVDRRMGSIADYCELGEWFDRPVRQYSSGMLARIGFAVAVNVDAEVLLVDEVLAVGDMTFQRRCYDRIAELKSRDVTILLVSHNIRQIERLCDRAILMEKGTVIFEGASGRVADRYFNDVLKAEKEAADMGGAARMQVQSAEGVALTDVSFRDRAGRRLESVRSGDAVCVHVGLRFDKRVESPVVAVGLVTSDMMLIGAVGNEFHASRTYAEGDTLYVCIIKTLPLLPGVYALRLKVRDANSALLLAGENVATLRVESNEGMRYGLDKAGLVALDVEWRQEKERHS